MPDTSRKRRRFAALVAACGLALTVGIAVHADDPGHPSDRGTPVPHTIGPIPVTPASHPFGATSVDLATYGYEEQEFFYSGTANVYDYGAAGKVVVRASGPYVNRLMVLRPISARRFSGSVLVELDNMTNRWDLEKMWYSDHDQLMRDGDAYVGVTSSPMTVASLKAFDPTRYASLSWANPVPPVQRCASPDLNATPDGSTEGGLAWDILSQAGAALKNGGRDNPLRGLDVERLYATGYSQSAGYLTRYINAISSRATLADGRPVYDGYLLGADVLSIPLNSCSAAIPQADPRNVIQPGHQPVIDVQTQTDFYNLGGFEEERADSDAPGDGYRLYQVPGSSHSSEYTTGLVPFPADLARAGFTYSYYNCTDAGYSNDFPLWYIFNGAIVNLDAWVRHGIAPPHAGRIQVTGAGTPNWATVLDAHGNAVGGLRTPWVDVPTQTYFPTSTPGFSCSLFGHRVPFDKATLLALYPNHGAYAIPFIAETQQVVRDRWITPEDGEAIINVAANSSVPA